MKGVAGENLRALNDAVRILYSADETNDFPSVLIRVAEVLFEGTQISVDEVLVPDGRVIHRADKNYPAGSEEFWARWPEFAHQHPGVRYVAGGGKRPVIAISDFLSLRQFRQLGIYAEIYKPNGIEDQIATTISLPSSALGLAISADTAFNREQKEWLSLVHPHLLPAYENFQNRVHLAKMVKLSSEALDVAQEGIISCRRNGRIMLANLSAWKLLHNYFPSTSRQAAVLPSKLILAMSRQANGAMEIKGPQGLLRLRWSETRESSVCLVLRESHRTISEQRARKRGLTSREIEVARLLMQGKTNIQISRELGISPHTGRTHVERILFKLQVSTRTAAATLLGE